MTYIFIKAWGSIDMTCSNSSQDQMKKVVVAYLRCFAIAVMCLYWTDPDLCVVCGKGNVFTFTKASTKKFEFSIQFVADQELVEQFSFTVKISLQLTISGFLSLGLPGFANSLLTNRHKDLVMTANSRSQEKIIDSKKWFASRGYYLFFCFF